MVYLLKISLGGVIKNGSKLYIFLSLVYQNSILIKHYKVAVDETVEVHHIIVVFYACQVETIQYLSQSKSISYNTCEKQRFVVDRLKRRTLFFKQLYINFH